MKVQSMLHCLLLMVWAVWAAPAPPGHADCFYAGQINRHAAARSRGLAHVAGHYNCGEVCSCHHSNKCMLGIRAL